MVKFLDLKKQYLSIKDEVDSAIFDIIENTAFVGGKAVSNFENNFASYIGTEYCVGVGNGTDALVIALYAMDLPKGSEVIVPANSFIATSEAVTLNGLKVVFADVNDDYLLNIESVKSLINDNTSAIIPVHLYGQPCDMDSIMSLAKEYNLKVLEDCAQAHGATYKGKVVGTFGDAATFSFYPGKNLGAYGDGGAIVTNNKDIEQKSRMYSNHGRSDKYAHQVEGVNSRLDGIQAAVLDVKLKHLDSWIKRRNEVANFYLDKLKEFDIILPKINDGVLSVYHLFVIRVKDRDALREFLGSKDIQTGIHYPTALPKLEAYKNHTQDCSDFFACSSDSELLSLPMGEHLEDEDIQKVYLAIKEYFTK
jgi:dTDP-4-amino-4,6-dideoxygalactose transaminase